jgi:protein SCO1/2
MKKKLSIIIFILTLCALKMYAQEDSVISTEVGITEHLGSTIPLDLKFTNENGEPITLRKIVDKPTILSFVYFDCPGLCSPLLEGVSDVIKKTDLTLGKEYQVVTVSFNFRDTPEKAKKKKEIFTKRYSKEMAENWKFLTTDSATIFKMIGSVGFHIKAVGLDFVHPSAIVIVSPEGKITRYLYGISFLPFDLKMALIEANKGQVRPTIQRLLLYCFSYDPQGKRYAMEITKLAGTIIIFFIVIFFIVLLIIKRRKVSKTIVNG